MAEKAKKAQKITKGKVVVRKKKNSPIEKSFKIAWDYIQSDVLIPALKDMLYEAVVGGASSVIFRDTNPVRSSAPRSRNGVIVSNGNHNVNYNKAYRGNPAVGARPEPQRNVSRTSYYVNEVIVSSRSEADEIIMSLSARIEQYEMATVGDLYSMVGFTGTPTDEKWGWYDLRGATTRRTNNGHILILPDPEALL